MTKKNWVPVNDWSSAKKWIDGGKSKISRPLYDRYLSIRLIEPDNPDTDISLNYRYRHISLDPKARKRSSGWNDVNYQETLNPQPNENNWIGEYRKPILIYKKDGTVLLSGVHRYGQYKVMSDYSGLVGVIRKRKVVKVRQPNDTLLIPKIKRRCRLCAGAKYFTYTCWHNIGPMHGELDILNNVKDGWDFACLTYNSKEHTTHVHRMLCGRCAGTGYSKVAFERWDSYVWEDDVDLLANQSTQELIL